MRIFKTKSFVFVDKNKDVETVPNIEIRSCFNLIVVYNLSTQLKSNLIDIFVTYVTYIHVMMKIHYSPLEQKH